MTTTNELPTPDNVAQAKRAMEIARIWLVDSHQEVVLSTRMWKDPGAWGLMLSDLALHVANAYEHKGYERNDVLKRIYEAFDAERASPTDEPKETGG
jgi:hypothetical protein